MRPVLNSMLVLPALTYCLGELRGAEELEDYRDLAWFRTITQAMRQAGQDLEAQLSGEAESGLTTIEIAQMLLQGPLQTALDEAMRFSTVDEEDES